MNKNLTERLCRKAEETDFSGVVFLESNGDVFHQAFGDRDRANRLPNTGETRFGLASGTKGFTALGIAALIDAGEFGLDTCARAIVGDRIENLNPDITIGQLLSHTSGIGDYYDEDEIGDSDEFVLGIPVQNLVSPLDYIPLLEEKAQKFPPGTASSYSNSGYIALAIIIELVASMPYQKFIENAVFAPAQMERSGFFRSDCLPADTALGYVSDQERLRTNIFHLPVVGGGDGGAYATAEDMARFWTALKASRIVPLQTLAPFLQPQSTVDNQRYGYGFWFDDKLDHIKLVGLDAGVSFFSSTSPAKDESVTIMSNTSSGAWPLVSLIRAKGLK
ncbi:MAG: beta-lactamase family protein [Caldilineaceae bacterium]|nr:beta-lactamase family protein [Caldilineaceae bacterium]